MATKDDTNFTADVIVIGGGPGGSTTATMLARKGLHVVLFERERFPRDHVGESLLPASVPVLEELGVLSAIQDAGFLPKWGATMVWGKESSPWSWYFRETNKQYPHSYQVWRPQFDQLLLENSRANAVDVREGHTVREVLFKDSRAYGVRFTDELGDEREAYARFIMDASGQAGLLSRKLRLRQWDSFFQNIAVYGYFANSRRLPEPDETNIFIESYPNGWFWNIPLHTGLASIGAVVDSRTGQQEINSVGLEGFLEDQIRQSPYIAGMLSEATMLSGPFIVKDWSYRSKRMVGDGYVLVGDAACFVDPLFSSGVHMALRSGVLAAAHVTTALKDPDMQQAAGQVYEELYLKEYSHFRELAKLFYTSNRTVDSYFWEARRVLDAGRYTPRHAFIRAVAGQSPRGYERAVMERGHLPDEFVSGVRHAESERQRRRALMESTEAQADFYNATPRLAEGVRVERKPVIAEGEFVWSYVITTSSQPEGVPCSPLVARIVSLINGQISVKDIIARLCEGLDVPVSAQIRTSALAALQILFVDGAIDGLSAR